MTTEVGKSEPADRQVSRAPFVLEWAIAVVTGWCTGMFAAYGIIIANAKIGSGPLAHPVGTWFVGVRSAVLAIIFAIVIRFLLGQSKKRLLLAAALGVATPLATLFWLYS